MTELPDLKPYPRQITVFCDRCRVEFTGDFLVNYATSRPKRLEFARAHVRTLGWRCDRDGDFCPRCKVLADIAGERDRQNAKWGSEQTHPDGTGGVEFLAHAMIARQRCDENTKAGKVTWTDILLEELCEAFAESDLAKLRAELIQVAAVAAEWVEDIDRRAAPQGGES